MATRHVTTMNEKYEARSIPFSQGGESLGGMGASLQLEPEDIESWTSPPRADNQRV
jgi:hypothetical protein